MSDARGPRLAIHVLLGVRDGVTDEVTQECDRRQIPMLLKQLDAEAPHWRVITIVHVEDLPLLLDGAARSDQETTP